jgi:general secretion pathway protein G
MPNTPELQPRREEHANEDGYTLIELLVVIGILGLLAVIATPQVLNYLASARVSTAKTEVENLSSALDLFKYDMGRYPSSQEGLLALLAAPEGSEGWHGPYVKRKANLVDPWGHAFHYLSPGQHGEFDLFSYGPQNDGNGNEDSPAIASW